MSQPNGRQEFIRTVERAQHAAGFNPLQHAIDNYHQMSHERDDAVRRMHELVSSNSSLLAEVNMLREALERADTDRIRLQAISSTLLGRLLAINDCIGGAVKASIREGIEAVAEAAPDPDLEQAAQEAQIILQRVQPLRAPEEAGYGRATVEPLQRLGGAIPAPVDWSQMPQQTRR